MRGLALSIAGAFTLAAILREGSRAEATQPQTDRVANKKRIQHMLDNMPKKWRVELEAARQEHRNLGLEVTPEDPTVDDIVETVLEITAGERKPGTSHRAKPRGPADVIVWDEIADEAMKGLELAFREGYPAWKFIGLARGMQLATREKIWRRSRDRAAEYLRRHQVDKFGKGFGDDRKPSNGYMAYLVWGGEPAWEAWGSKP